MASDSNGFTSGDADAVRQKVKLGFALIISNDYSTTPPKWDLPELTGTEVDARLMDGAFKALNFDTRRECNLERRQLIQIVYETAQCRGYPKHYKAIAVVFSGHGNSTNCLYMQDGSTVTIREIVEQFLPSKAPAIGNIPKLFFIDACRGSEVTQSVAVPRGGANQHEVFPKGGNKVSTLQVPDQGNFLLAHSTMPNYQAYELKGKGGIWMSTLAAKLRTSRKSVEDILSEVNEEMMQRFQSPEWRDRMQQPEKLSRLNKVVYLHPEAAASQPGDFPRVNGPQPGLGRSNSQEVGQYRGMLNGMYQLDQITKPEFTCVTTECSEGTRFKGIVTFKIDGGSKMFESPKSESSKSLAQEKAAESACKWMDNQSRARSAVVRKPDQPQSPPQGKASQVVTSSSPGAGSPAAPPPATGGSPTKTSASRLKEFCDKQRCGDPEYREVPVPEDQRFKYTVTVKTPPPVTAEGEVCNSKKEARQSAAQKALQKIGM